MPKKITVTVFRLTSEYGGECYVVATDISAWHARAKDNGSTIVLNGGYFINVKDSPETIAKRFAKAMENSSEEKEIADA